MPHIPTALLILLSTLATALTPTKTTTLLPPYGPGPATYYASILNTDTNGTTYKIACLPAPTNTNTDACLTAHYGTHPQTFYQGPSTWRISRPLPASKISNFAFSTTCAAPTTVSWSKIGSSYGYVTRTLTMDSCVGVETPLACRVDATNVPPLGGLGVETKGLCGLGLREQEVLMVETVPTPMSTTGFTDIGRGGSQSVPVTTMTLYKQSGGAKEGRSGRVWVVAVVVGVLGLFGMG